MTCSRDTVGKPSRNWSIDSPVEIVEQGLHRHPRAAEDRRATHDLGIAGHDGLLHAENVLLPGATGNGATRMTDRPPILIAGPTASGKSALALRLAERLGGIVINANSMQVYRDLRVITARPSPEEEARAPHRLYGHVDAAENYSTGRWCRDVAARLTKHAREGRVPIFVGGTGLYFKALTRGLRRAADPGRHPRRCARSPGDGGRRAALRRAARRAIRRPRTG